MIHIYIYRIEEARDFKKSQYSKGTLGHLSSRLHGINLIK